MNKDEKWMQIALNEANLAMNENESSELLKKFFKSRRDNQN